MMQEEQERIVDDGQPVLGFFGDDVQYAGAVQEQLQNVGPMFFPIDAFENRHELVDGDILATCRVLGLKQSQYSKLLRGIEFSDGRGQAKQTFGRGIGGVVVLPGRGKRDISAEYRAQMEKKGKGKQEPWNEGSITKARHGREELTLLGIQEEGLLVDPGVQDTGCHCVGNAIPGTLDD